MQVTRGAATLPAAHVPALAAGDRLWLKADLPEQQAAHYLMVAVFLRGSTNPPPADWFTRCETWAGKCAKEGMTITVPREAQQLLLFLAPETGGDFKTLMNAVRGRPGTFVRTSQDLNQATLDRSRLDSYVKAVRSVGEDDPDRLKEAAPLLARSLAIKVDEKCLDKMSVLQAPCLMQGRESMILNDGHSASIAQALTSGPASDLAMEASSTAQLKYGYYGPYIGSIFDIARIFDSIHTAQYQYIPALASASGSRLALTLNAPPSFHDPKSVLVVALPAIENPQLPPLHAVDPKALPVPAGTRWCYRSMGRRWCSRPATHTAWRCTCRQQTARASICRSRRLRHAAGWSLTRPRSATSRSRTPPGPSCRDSGDSIATKAQASRSWIRARSPGSWLPAKMPR